MSFYGIEIIEMIVIADEVTVAVAGGSKIIAATATAAFLKQIARECVIRPLKPRF